MKHKDLDAPRPPKAPHLTEAVPVLLEHFLEQLRAELATSNNGVRETGARPVPYADRQMSTSPGAVIGFSLAETTGAAVATVILRDGTDASGPVIAYITLAAGQSKTDWFGPGGVGFGRGLFLDKITGTIDGAVWLRAVE